MSVLISAQNLTKSFGAKTLFQNLTFGIEENQKIGLIGPNGAGKSTLLKILSNLESVDNGELRKARNLTLGYLAQNPTFKSDDTIYDAIINATMDPYDSQNIQLAYELISKFNLDSSDSGAFTLVSTLSGGWQKRVALARELIKKPNLLLLDEPTNHLDIESILWLEDLLSNQHDLATLTVTHDRLFLEKTSNTIFDLDVRNPDGLIKFQGSYANFLDHKANVVHALQRQEQTQKNTLRRETEWLRRGAKARLTKQKARIDRAHELADTVAELQFRNRQNILDVQFGKNDRFPKKMVELKNLTQKWADRLLYKDFSLLVGPGTRVGLLGKNGCGKTTLIRSIIGEIQPNEGTVFVSDLIKISYFAQKKEGLNPNIPLLKTICPEGDYVQYQGQPVFARSYLSRFLFRNDQMDLPVGKLSGGEQSRLLIAKMMLDAESLLILDEPTNDLDIETLDVLQDALTQFPGAVILVTHDRYFLDSVCNQIYAFDEWNPQLVKFADYFQWQEWYQQQIEIHGQPSAKNEGPKDSSTNKKGKSKLSYKEQREWDSMESEISEAEKLFSEMEAELALQSSGSDYQKLQDLTQQMQTQKSKIDKMYQRWQVLSEKLK